MTHLSPLFSSPSRASSTPTAAFLPLLDRARITGARAAGLRRLRDLKATAEIAFSIEAAGILRPALI